MTSDGKYVLDETDAKNLEKSVNASRQKIVRSLASRYGLAKTREDAEDLFNESVAKALVAVAEDRLGAGSVHFGYLRKSSVNNGKDRKKAERRLISLSQPSGASDESDTYDPADYLPELRAEDPEINGIAQRSANHAMIDRLQRLTKSAFTNRPRDWQTAVILYGVCHKVIDTLPGDYESDSIRSIQGEMITAIVEGDGLDVVDAEGDNVARNAAKQSLKRVRDAIFKCLLSRGVTNIEGPGIKPQRLIDAISEIEDDDYGDH